MQAGAASHPPAVAPPPRPMSCQPRCGEWRKQLRGVGYVVNKDSVSIRRRRVLRRRRWQV